MTAPAEAISHPPTLSRQHWVLVPMLCALLAAAVYACSLRGTYILDDRSSVIGDPRVTNGAWKDLWTQGYRVAGFDKLYRPLVCTSFALEWRLHGDRPWAFHLVNLLLHAAVTWTLTLLASRMLGETPALIAGLLFAILPIHTEAVVNIVGRAEMMCALGTLYGLYAFLTRPLSGRLMLTLAICFLVAALSKEQGILFPLLLLAAVPLRSSQGHPPASPKMRRLFLAVFLWLPAAYLVFRESMVPMWWDRNVLLWEANPILRARGLDRILLPVVVFGHYVQLATFPIKLSYDYSARVIGWHVRPTDPYLYLGAFAAAGVAAAGVWSFARRQWTTFLAVAGLLLTYGLVSNTFVIIGTLMGERLAYLPSAFFLLLVSRPISRLPRPVLVGCLSTAVALMGLRNVTYAIRWNAHPGFLLWSLENQPNGKFVYTFVYRDYVTRGDWEAALQIARRLRARMPDILEAHYMCIELEMALGRYEEAQRAAMEGEAQPFLESDKLPMRMMWAQAAERLSELKNAKSHRGAGPKGYSDQNPTGG